VKVSDALRARLATIELIAFDVDGVLTQGDILYTDQGAEVKGFDVKDGLGLRVARSAGLQVAIITGRASRTLERRARDLHITDVLQRVGDKALALRQLGEEKSISLDRMAFMGDDVNDLEAMKVAGISMAPADAVPEVLQKALLVTEARAGRGAAREAVEAVLKAQGRWESAVEGYLDGLAERDRARRAEGK
jgi:3-deoxy-D-manno-octulosonate 8-phosphate phosphatase (KDO 8-P phosphatase)